MGRFAIEFWGVQAAVEWSPKFDPAAAGLLLPIWAHDPKLDPEAVFRLTTDGSGHTTISGPGSEWNHLFNQDPVDALERRLHLYLASETRQVAFVHAGAVEWKGRAILFPGRSYAGKSTLIHALVKAGASFLSDEYAIIDPHGHVHPFPRPISLREADGIRRIYAQELGWTGGAGKLSPSAIVVANYQQGQTWHPQAMTPGAAVLELMSNTVAARAAPTLAMQCLSQTVKDAHCWKGTRGDADSTAVLILKHLSEDP